MVGKAGAPLVNPGEMVVGSAGEVCRERGAACGFGRLLRETVRLSSLGGEVGTVPNCRTLVARVRPPGAKEGEGVVVGFGGPLAAIPPEAERLPERPGDPVPEAVGGEGVPVGVAGCAGAPVGLLSGGLPGVRRVATAEFPVGWKADRGRGFMVAALRDGPVGV